MRNSKNAVKLRSKRNKVRTKKEVKKSDLVHVNKSPNFCKHNPKKGILGTKDRECSKSSQDSDSCSSLCCGRGYDTQVRICAVDQTRNPESASELEPLRPGYGSRANINSASVKILEIGYSSGKSIVTGLLLRQNILDGVGFSSTKIVVFAQAPIIFKGRSWSKVKKRTLVG